MSTSTRILGLLLFFLPAISFTQVDAGLFQYPDVSDSQITFVYGNDIWIVPKAGGQASRLSSPDGAEVFPRFSPDGTQIAYSGSYGGNQDVYVIPAKGGVPQRLTWHGMTDVVMDWHPKGDRLLIRSSRYSGRQRYSQFLEVPVSGGLPELTTVPYGEFATYSPDGKSLAYTPKSRIFRSWKRYRGGTATDIYLFNLSSMEAQNISQSDANDELPMWHKDKVYFLSDRGPFKRFNIWSYDTRDGQLQQLTKFDDFDIHFPSLGPEEIVFVAGGKMYLLNLATENLREVSIQVVSDQQALIPRMEKVKGDMQSLALSPDGQRAVVEARGELFSVPAEKGVVKNWSQSSGIAERHPAWSPDGKHIAYWTDRKGEYELALRDLRTGKEKIVTQLGPGYRYRLYWSPDSKKLAFIDQAMRIHVHNLESRDTRQVDQALYMYEGSLRGFEVSWSPDSRWLAYSRGLESRHQAVFLYDTEAGKRHQVTSQFYSHYGPKFDPEGKYLYVYTNRHLSPVYSDYEGTWSYPNATKIGLFTLREDLPSPLHAQNDTVAIEKEENQEDSDNATEEKKEEGDNEEGVEIDLEDMERRLVILPIEPGNFGRMEAAKGKLIFHRRPNTGSGDKKRPILYFDLKKREEKTMVDNAGTFYLSANDEKMLVGSSGNWYVVDVAPKQDLKKAMPLDEMEAEVIPQQEWTQIFNDAWRFERDFFYDENMHGVDWEAMRKRYGALVKQAASRRDVNFILGELIGELNASHTYRSGGDLERGDRRNVGYLGVDWEMDGEHYRIKRIVRAAPWETEVRSPFDEPGMTVKAGDYILAVNGVPLTTDESPYAAFDGLAGKTVELTVGEGPEMERARSVVVDLLSSETRLRHLAWIEQNRKRVEEVSNGKIGYVYVRSTGIDGQNELVRQFYAQYHKPGMIVDERFNSGGQIPDRFIELLNREPLAYWDVRDGANWQWPAVAHFGPKAMLINGWSGSGGDAFPDYFRKSKLGPLIGTRTWGGLIGITGSPTLVDGGRVTVPTFRMYNPDGSWFPEGYGVAPDIEVEEDPSQLARGIDPQLERAIKEVLQKIKPNDGKTPTPPKVEDRSK